MKAEILFLGTGSATPTKERNHSAILLSYGAEKILIDCGEGTQRQMKIAGINPCKLTRILITHWHGDHVLGVPGLLDTLAMSEYSKTLKIYGPEKTREKLSLLEKVYGKFKIKTKINEIKGKGGKDKENKNQNIIEEQDFIVSFEEMFHGIHALAYSFIIKEKIRIKKEKLEKMKIPNSPLLARLQQGKDVEIRGKKLKAKLLTYKQPRKKITLIFDTKFNEKAIKFAEKSDFLVCESTYSLEEKDKAEEYNHLTSQQAAEIAKKSKSKSLVLTHLSQRYDYKPKKIEAEARKIFKNTRVAKDFDKFSV